MGRYVIRLAEQGNGLWLWSVSQIRHVDSGYSSSIEDALDRAKRATLIHLRETQIAEGGA